MATMEPNPQEHCKVVLIRSMHEEGLAHDVVEGVVEDDSDDEEEKNRERKRERERVECGKCRKNDENEKNCLQEGIDEVLIPKTKSHVVRKAKKGACIEPTKDVPYPLVPSRKEKEHYFARFLDIFNELEITIPFGEAPQQMLLYAKFLKELLTKKDKYINNESIIVEGNCSAMLLKTPSKVQ